MAYVGTKWDAAVGLDDSFDFVFFRGIACPLNYDTFGRKNYASRARCRL